MANQFSGPRRATHLLVLLGLCLALSANAGRAAETDVRQAQHPPTNTRSSHYVTTRAPLRPTPLVKLPPGAIEPKGWLLTQLQYEAEGMVGHMEELSKWVDPEDSAWLSPKGKGTFPWEELPYWLRGYGDLGYVLDNEKIIEETEMWLDAVIASQRESGWFGPVANLSVSDDISTEEYRGNLSKGGNPDFWPNMIMLDALQSYYEYTGDERVLELMTNYFRFQMEVPEENFLVPYWQKQRAGDNLQSVYWLYNRTGDKWLLDLAHKIHRNMARWDEGVASWHVVNIAQCFREPATYWLQKKDDSLLQATRQDLRTVKQTCGQVPGGMYGADEVFREGYHGPRQAAETCGMVEIMHSFEMLTRYTGNTTWADRCEEVAFNSYPAALTPKARGLHYLTAPNQVLLDKKNHHPAIQRTGMKFAYSPHQIYRCCQHNHTHGWPYYAQELWHATSDDGLAASLYCASEVTAKVADGTKVTMTEKTRYPFDDTVNLEVNPAEAVAFPLYLRIPGWCDDAKASLNGQKLDASPDAGSYLVIERTWQPGDTVQLRLPMNIRATVWDKDYEDAITEPNGSVSVSRGPLTYSLRIGEKWIEDGGTEEWPVYHVEPTTDWNYGLVIDPENPAESISVKSIDESLAEQPFTPENAPVKLQAKAKKIPNWQIDHLSMVGKMQENPVRSDQPTETVTLVPMGCQRLRISAFPRIGSGPDSHRWKKPPKPAYETGASHVWKNDTTLALSDGQIPDSSDDGSIPRFTWWSHKGTKEWVEYRFDEPKTLSSAEVYWFDDRGRGGCRVPKSWKLLYEKDGKWKPVSGVENYGTERDQFNKVSFEPVKTTAIRLQVQLRPDYSGGILEWRVNGEK